MQKNCRNNARNFHGPFVRFAHFSDFVLIFKRITTKKEMELHKTVPFLFLFHKSIFVIVVWRSEAGPVGLPTATKPPTAQHATFKTILSGHRASRATNKRRRTSSNLPEALQPYTLSLLD